MTRQTAAIVIGLALLGAGVSAQQRGGNAPAAALAPGSAQALAPVDLTGWWVSIVTEDWRFRMVTPPKGDFASLPLNADGRALANKWEPSQDGRCEAYGAAAIMRMPGRLHITWADDNTLKIDTDAGTQTRLLHFTPATAASAAPTLQGQSSASWITPAAGFRGFGGPPGPGAGGRGGPAAGRGRAGGLPPPPGRGRGGARSGLVRAETTNLKPGWLRKNGAPYSGKTTMTENFMRVADGGDEWLVVQSTVVDPMYLAQSFITSESFKREPDGSKWHPTTCRAN